MEKILAAGANITINLRGAEGFRFMECKYCVVIEFRGLRNGLRGDDLQEIFARAWEWVEEVDFFHGTQWTPEQLMSAARAD